MKFHDLPGTDVSVSQLCFGCWGITGDLHWGERVEAESVGAMDAALEAGVNFYDTAPMYADGASEELLGRFVKDRGVRDRIVIASKIRPNMMAPADVIAECDGSLTRLQIDCIDLYQTHWTSPDVPLSDTWGAMRLLQDQGKVKHIGVCNAGVEDLDTVSGMQKPVTNQVPYNLLWRMIEPAILPKCAAESIGVLVYSPLFHGLLADKYQTLADVPDGRARSRHFSSERPHTRHGEAGCEALTTATLARIRGIAAETNRSMAELALAWTIQQPGITSVIAGARNAEQLNNNAAFLDSPLDDDVMAQLDDATAELKSALGDNPDMWDGGENSRYH